MIPDKLYGNFLFCGNLRKCSEHIGFALRFNFQTTKLIRAMDEHHVIGFFDGASFAKEKAMPDMAQNSLRAFLHQKLFDNVRRNVIAVRKFLARREFVKRIEDSAIQVILK